MSSMIHTEHRDVIHDCSYDYYGQVDKVYPIFFKSNKMLINSTHRIYMERLVIAIQNHFLAYGYLQF